MTSQQHLSPEEITALLDDALSDLERSLAEHHLAECDTCRNELAAMRGLTELLHQLPQYDPPRSFALTREDIATPPPVTPSVLRWLPAVRTLSVAAVVAFLIVSSIVVIDQVTGDDGDISNGAMISETGTGSDAHASQDMTGDSDAESSGLIERGDSAAKNSAPPPAPSSEKAAAADQDDLAQTTATPGVTDANPEETPAVIASTVDAADDDGNSWLMTSIGLGALAIVLAGLWLILVRMGRAQRRLA
jgi:hypothetical protein